jgi:hypothetical protein
MYRKANSTIRTWVRLRSKINPCTIIVRPPSAWRALQIWDINNIGMHDFSFTLSSVLPNKVLFPKMNISDSCCVQVMSIVIASRLPARN